MNPLKFPSDWNSLEPGLGATEGGKASLRPFINPLKFPSDWNSLEPGLAATEGCKASLRRLIL